MKNNPLTKTIRIATTCFTLCLLLMPNNMKAASLYSAPALDFLNEGESISVVYTVDADAESVYTVKLDVSWPATLLTLESFTFAEGWTALPQDGYDEIDQSAGTFIKTAGYTKGVTDSRVFGTAVFRALASGQGDILSTTNSFVLNSENDDVLSAQAKTGIVVPAEEVITEPTPETEESEEESDSESSESVSEVEATSTAPIILEYHPNENDNSADYDYMTVEGASVTEDGKIYLFVQEIPADIVCDTDEETEAICEVGEILMTETETNSASSTFFGIYNDLPVGTYRAWVQTDFGENEWGDRSDYVYFTIGGTPPVIFDIISNPVGEEESRFTKQVFFSMAFWVFIVLFLYITYRYYRRMRKQSKK